MSKNTGNGKNIIEYYWSQKYWEQEAERIELAYWELLKSKIPDVMSLQEEAKPTEHRIEAFVRALSRKHQLSNLHVGLTSSDLEDNIRIKRLERCAMEISIKKNGMILSIKSMGDPTLVAYTHLLPAGVTTLQARFAPTIEAIEKHNLPVPVFKGIKGAIGQCQIQEKLGMTKRELDSIFTLEKLQEYSHQTGNHLSDFQYACWIAGLAGFLAKIANDFRQMFALNQAYHTQKDIGSTAIASKKPNPWRFERAFSMAAILFDLPGQVAKIVGDCALERTLTNQSALNYLFERACFLLWGIVEDLETAINDTGIVDQTEECKNPSLHSEEQMLELIMGGIPRELAHQKINEKYTNVGQ